LRWIDFTRKIGVFSMFLFMMYSNRSITEVLKIFKLLRLSLLFSLSIV
jgi:hypothetical protein